MLGTKVVLFLHHVALKYLLKKKEAKPRLIQWILLLQEFDMEIKDKRGIENLVTDHLSHVWLNRESATLKDKFLYEKLFSVHQTTP